MSSESRPLNHSRTAICAHPSSHFHGSGDVVCHSFCFLRGTDHRLCIAGYDQDLAKHIWLVWFIPLIISSGGNSAANLRLSSSRRSLVKMLDSVNGRRSLYASSLRAWFWGAFCRHWILDALTLVDTPIQAAVIPVTILAVVLCGTF